MGCGVLAGRCLVAALGRYLGRGQGGDDKWMDWMAIRGLAAASVAHLTFLSAFAASLFIGTSNAKPH